MIQKSELGTCWVRRLAACSMVTLLLVLPGMCPAATVTLTKEGPSTAREGDMVEYVLAVVNEGTAVVQGLEVLDTLPSVVTYVDAIPTAGGTFDPVTGIWTLPALGTTAIDKVAGLRLQALVDPNLLTGPADVVTADNRAEVIAPASQTPVEAAVTTNIVCAFCIDWEIVSVTLDSSYRVPYPDPLETRYFLQVEVANNGPVMSDATVSVTTFGISGGGFGAVTLFPVLPVSLTLDAGETRTLTYATDWLVGPDSTYTITWDFEVSDVALLDPVLPNTASGSWTGTVEGGPGGACFIATAAYGSYLDPHVRRLRRFRDETLLHSRLGRTLVAWYYELSPPIAAFIERDETLKALTRILLTPLVFAVEHPGLVIAGVCGMALAGFARRARIKRGMRG